MTEWAIFDYGEVLSERTTALPDLAALMGVEPVQFEQAYWAHRADYDSGIDDVTYWRRVGADLGVRIEQDTASELTAVDVAGWSHTNPTSLALLDELGKAGVPLALLSNASSTFARFAETQDWARYFRHTLFSGDLGIAKPDPAIFHELLRRIGANAADCLFFDDRQSNVDGARAVGMRAHRWLGGSQARATLRDSAASGRSFL